MKKKLVLSLIFTGCFYSTYFAQFSAYGSVSYGYNQNPLYNYERKGDQLKQTYLELNYLKDFDNSQLKFSYVSGLMIFNQLNERNYYEHNFFSRYSIKFSKDKTVDITKNIKDGSNIDESEQEDESSENNESADEDSLKTVQTEDEEASDDSTGKYLDLMAKIGARHDKDLFREFDNTGANFLMSYKFMPEEDFSVRLTNDFGFRNYTNIEELSNLTDQLILQLSNKFNGSYSYGIRLSGAYKYYTSTVYDTTKFESQRTYKKKPGKGKGGAAITVPSGKEILLQPQSNGTSQLSAGLFFIKTWQSSSFETVFLYRYNPKTQTRYLAQRSNAGINEDLYNDFFSYQGPEGHIKYNTPLFFGLQMSLEMVLAEKNFEAPALDLNGDEISSHRKDINTSAEMFISRPINILGDLSLDIILGTGILRNQSNDDYNDFSVFSFSGGIGIGL